VLQVAPHILLVESLRKRVNSIRVFHLLRIVNNARSVQGSVGA
jgi:hypothetical protein